MNDQSSAKIKETFALAIQHHQQGDVSNAEKLCREVLQILPNQPDCMMKMRLITGKIMKSTFPH